MNRFPNFPGEPLIKDAVSPPPWVVSENRELTNKYIEVMQALEKYGYTLEKTK